MRKIEELVEDTISLIENFCSKERAEKLLKLIEDIGQEKYFSAPASSKNDYHNSFPGGLAEHNLNVLMNLKDLVDTFKFSDEITDEEICVASILHDIGKAANTDGDEFYVAMQEKWKKDKGENYDYSYGSTYFPTNQRTLFLIQKHNFELSPKEYQAILLNDGLGLEGNRVYSFRQNTLTLLLQMADQLATIKEKKQAKQGKNA